MLNMKGIADSIIRQLSDVTNINTPQYKITAPGLLDMLLNNPAPVKITNLAQIQAGHDREIRLRYMQRGTPDEAKDVDTCDSGADAAYEETTVTHPLFKMASLYISNIEMQQYYDEATAQVSLGSVGIMAELYNRIRVKLSNTLLGAIDKALLTEMATRWGVNAATGKADPNHVYLYEDPCSGFVQIIDEAARNELVGQLLIVGSGAMNKRMLADRFKIAPNYDGYKFNNFSDYKWYNDYYAETVWGKDHFGVIAPGSASFIDWNKNVGYNAGTQGNSYFFPLPVPVFLSDGTFSNLILDAQLKELDCKEVMDDGVTRDRGYILYLGKSFGLFTTPTDAYSANDRLAGSNGLLHYIGQMC